MKLHQAHRIVIKIGSAVLIDAATGTLRQDWFNALIKDINQCVERGQEVLIVSSGAIGLGKHYLKGHPEPLTIDAQQAAAAIGQIQLAHTYQQLLRDYGHQAAQILLTVDDIQNRQRYLNAKYTLEKLLELKAIPIINENDTVATNEICFGDNDRLAGRVTQMIGADLLILLSDVDGFYSTDPNKDPNAVHYPVVRNIDEEIKSKAGMAISNVGTGGMITKLAAAEIVTEAGGYLCLTTGHPNSPLQRIERGERCTWFLPTTTPALAKQRWLREDMAIFGKITLNQDALARLNQGEHVLPVHVLSSEGRFEQGDVVSLCSHDGKEVARGFVNYSAADTKRIQGKSNLEVEKELGYCLHDEIVHFDNVVMMEKGNDQ